MEHFSFFQGETVISFLLLFVRISFLLALLPLFSNMSIPATVKAGLSLYLTFIFYFSITPPELPDSWFAIGTAIFSEMIFALIAGLVLNLAIYMLTYAGEHISLMMGFSMATVFDYQTSISMPMISQFLSFLALMMLFAFDGHHMMLLFMHDSISSVPLGGFVMADGIFDYIVEAFKNLFVMGLSIAFPILALSLLSDIIFGMLMKTMPQFNLLVIGYPIKIGIGFIVLIAVISSMMLIFKTEFIKYYNDLPMLF
ncbi:Flagellar biosynthesis protein FliR [Thiovulum sp. ES]|nr:Flagellar biosynthesis protein FliR [Thiovulum sp. ES]